MNWRIVYIKSERRHFHMLSKVNNFRIFRIFNKTFFYEFCKRVQNTFMVKVGSFTVYFKIMLFWVTSWFFKNVPYDIALTCNYGMSIVIFWYFCDTSLLYSDKLYCIRRVRRCSYGTNCAWYNKIIITREFLTIQQTW